MPGGTVECLNKRELEMNYYRRWTHDRRFGEGFKEAGLCSGLDTVRKMGQFYDGVS